jgi:hypothetical protein
MSELEPDVDQPETDTPVADDAPEAGDLGRAPFEDEEPQGEDGGS